MFASGPSGPPVPRLETERLSLRDWRDADLAPFARLNADPQVMANFPQALSAAESDAFAARIRANLRAQGYGLFALERRDTGAFCGFVGFAHPSFSAAFTPCVEIGWRLAAEHQGQGFATEAARACLRHAFEDLGWEEVVSLTWEGNLPSRRVMEKLGMTRDPLEDFEHPRLELGSRLSRHVLYRIARGVPACEPLG